MHLACQCSVLFNVQQQKFAENIHFNNKDAHTHMCINCEKECSHHNLRNQHWKPNVRNITSKNKHSTIRHTYFSPNYPRPMWRNNSPLTCSLCTYNLSTCIYTDLRRADEASEQISMHPQTRTHVQTVNCRQIFDCVILLCSLPQAWNYGYVHWLETMST